MSSTARQKKLRKMREKAKSAQVKECPTSNKIPYMTRGKAENVVISMQIRGRYARAYECSCGVFHVSTKPPRGQGKRLPKVQYC